MVRFAIVVALFTNLVVAETITPVIPANLAVRYSFDTLQGKSLVNGVDPLTLKATVYAPYAVQPAGRIDGSLALSGGGYVLLPKSPLINQDIVRSRSISIWFKAKSLQGTQVIFKEGSAVNGSGVNIYLSNGKLYVGGWNRTVNESGWMGSFFPTDKIKAGKWHHVALTLTGGIKAASGEFIAYLDGEVFGRVLASRLYKHDILSIGRVTVNGTTLLHTGVYTECASGCRSYFEGEVDDFRLYNRVLPAEEIKHLALKQLSSQYCESRMEVDKTSSLNVMDTRFGVKADGVTDDAAGIQKALDFAYMNKVSVVDFPRHSYFVSSVFVPPGVVLNGNCSTMILKGDSRRYSRMFIFGFNGRDQNKAMNPYGWSNVSDSPKTTFQSFIFNLNRAIQPPGTTYALEQQAALFVDADATKTGRATFHFRESYFEHAAGDGIHMYNRANATIERIGAKDIFRGPVVVSGGGSAILVRDLIATRDGGHFDIEPTNDPGSMIANRIRIEDSSLDRIDIAATIPNSVIETLRMSVNGGRMSIVADPTSTISMREAQYTITDQSASFLIYGAGKKTEFIDSTFIADFIDRTDLATAAPRSSTPIHVNWKGYKGTRVYLTNCRFIAGPKVKPEDALRAVYMEMGRPEDDNQLIMTGTTISKDYDTGIEMKDGGVIKVSQSQIDASSYGIALRYRNDTSYPGYYYAAGVYGTKITSATPIWIEAGGAKVPGNFLEVLP